MLCRTSGPIRPERSSSSARRTSRLFSVLRICWWTVTGCVCFFYLETPGRCIRSWCFLWNLCRHDLALPGAMPYKLDFCLGDEKGRARHFLLQLSAPSNSSPPLSGETCHIRLSTKPLSRNLEHRRRNTNLRPRTRRKMDNSFLSLIFYVPGLAGSAGSSVQSFRDGEA